MLYHIPVLPLSGGFVGVDVFFVISGYLITGLMFGEIWSTGRFRFGNFYLRRLRRLFPAMLATIAGTFVTASIFFPPDLLREFCQSAIATLLSVSNLYFWQHTGYFDTSAIFRPLLHTWSLSIEEQFYLCWPLLLFCGSRYLRRRGLFVFAAIIAITSLAASIAYDDRQSLIYYLLPFRAFELAIGAMLALAPEQQSRPWLLDAAYMIGATLIVWAAVTYTSQTVFPSYNALAPCVGCALMIYAGRARYLPRLLNNPIAVSIGKISYSLYLAHWPIFVFFSYENAVVLAPLSRMQLAEVWLLVFIAATALYWIVEKPIRQGGGMLAGWRLAPAAAAAAALLALPAGAIVSNSGWASRFDRQLLSLIDEAKWSAGIPAAPGKCFIGMGRPSDVPPECFALSKGHQHFSILLIGDSTAFHLYAGLHVLLKDRADIYTWTASVCPPVANFNDADFPNCGPAMREFFTSVLPSNRYDLALAAVTGRDSYMSSGFESTKARFAEAGIPLVLVGETIQYRDSPAHLIARHGRLDGLPSFLRANMVTSCEGENGRDSLVAPDRFFSMKRILCIGSEPIYQTKGVLMHRDHIHLTEHGSLYVAKALATWAEQYGYLPTTQRKSITARASLL